MIDRDTDLYNSFLQSMAMLSGLFSQSKVPYINSRFVEKLFVLTTGAKDLGRADKSFDALLPGGVGVGIKTFTAETGSHKTEKVAEFTALAREGRFNTTDRKKLVRRVAEARNQRVLSNATEYGISMDQCVYHCLVRIEGGAVVHEEPYQLVNIENLMPTNVKGQTVDDWSFTNGKIYFFDGLSYYNFNISKNVLMKRFSFDRKSNIIELDLHPDPLDLLDQLVGRKPKSGMGRPKLTFELDGVDEEETGVPGKDYVVLPLYSTRTGEVEAKSGINQWNAGGRSRKFGEAYIPVPKAVHNHYQHFFPSRDTHFKLNLANGFTSQRAKICQSDGKALMTESNIELGRWLITVIDPSVSPSDFGKPPTRRHRPYTYRDLLAIGSDSVIVRRNGKGDYSVEFGPLGAYQEFESSM